MEVEETTPPPDGMLRATAGRVTRVVHCSDLHYGHGFLELRAEHLAERIKELKPDAVVVSGDLTMRARAGQFAKARKFLLELQTPLLVIPGNHDIPVYDVFTRMVMPFRNYNKYAGDLSTNPLVLPHVAFMGLNTVYVWKHQEGRVRPKELEQAVEWLKSLPGATWKVIVVHQHFINLEGHERPGVMYRGAEVLRTLSEAGADAILHGHTHYNRVIQAGDYFTGIPRRLSLVCVGTATSERTRGELQTNNYNLLDFTDDEYIVRQCDWSPEVGHFAECRQHITDRQSVKADNPPATA